ncbi:hypothetical protein D3C71_1014930 [compost metagenome]
MHARLRIQRRFDQCLRDARGRIDPPCTRQHRRQRTQHATGQPLPRTRLSPLAANQTRPHEGQRCKAQRAQVALQLALHLVVEEPGPRIRAHRRVQCEDLTSLRLHRPRDRQRIAVVHLAEGLPRAGLLHRRTQRTDGSIHLPTLGSGRQGRKVHDRVQQPGIGLHERTSGRGDHRAAARVGQQPLQHLRPHQSGGSSQQYSHACSCVLFQFKAALTLPIMEP